MKMNKGITFVMLLMAQFNLSYFALAQEEWEETGEIEDAQVIIEKDRTIELPTANRSYEKVPPAELNIQSNPQQYNFNENLYNGSRYTPTIKSQRLTPSSSTATGKNFVKAGFGNYISPLAEVSVNTVQKNLSAGLYFNHLSFARGPVDGKNSGSSDNTGKIYGVLSGKKSAFSVDLDFGSVKRYHYGFSDGNRSSIDPTKQRYSRFGINLGMQNTDMNSPINYSVRGGFYNLSDNFNAKENGFTSQVKVMAPLTDDLRIFTNLDLLFTKYEDTSDINRNIINVRGGVEYDLGNLTVTAAANIALTNDTISNSNDFKLYPYFKAAYKLTDEWSLSGGLIGELEAVTLRSISNENPFIAANLPLNHTNKQIEIFGKITGQLAQNFGIETGLSFANYENLYFYTDTLRFNLAYEPDATNVLNVFASLNYKYKKLIASTRLDYYSYSTKTLSEAWHRPGFTTSLNLNYQLNDALSFGSSLMILSDVKSLNPEGASSVTLDPIIDIGLEAHYRINTKFIGFIEVDNILSKKYERYFNYLNRSFMTHLGVIYSF